MDMYRCKSLLLQWTNRCTWGQQLTGSGGDVEYLDRAFLPISANKFAPPLPLQGCVKSLPLVLTNYSRKHYYQMKEYMMDLLHAPKALGAVEIIL